MERGGCGLGSQTGDPGLRLFIHIVMLLKPTYREELAGRERHVEDPRLSKTIQETGLLTWLISWRYLYCRSFSVILTGLGETSYRYSCILLR